MSDPIREVIDERRRQDDKWGPQNHALSHWYLILGEEVGEVARALFEGNPKQAREELVQVAAVAVAMIESMDRNELAEKPSAPVPYRSRMRDCVHHFMGLPEQKAVLCKKCNYKQRLGGSREWNELDFERQARADELRHEGK